jgi:hypothetical protein
MNDEIAGRIATALEQIALELGEKATVAPEPYRAVGPSQQPAPVFAPIGGWVCPDHGTVRVVPAGVSKRTGQPYQAFMVCDQQGCEQRPPKPGVPARAVAPSDAGLAPRSVLP